MACINSDKYKPELFGRQYVSFGPGVVGWSNPSDRAPASDPVQMPTNVDKAKLFKRAYENGCLPENILLSLGLSEIKSKNDGMQRFNVSSHHYDAVRRQKGPIRTDHLCYQRLLSLQMLTTPTPKDKKSTKDRELKIVMETFGWPSPKGKTIVNIDVRNFLKMIFNLLYSKWSSGKNRSSFLTELYKQLEILPDETEMTRDSSESLVISEQVACYEKENITLNCAFVLPSDEEVPEDWDA